MAHTVKAHQGIRCSMKRRSHYCSPLCLCGGKREMCPSGGGDPVSMDKRRCPRQTGSPTRGRRQEGGRTWECLPGGVCGTHAGHGPEAQALVTGWGLPEALGVRAELKFMPVVLQPRFSLSLIHFSLHQAMRLCSDTAPGSLLGEAMHRISTALRIGRSP